MLTAENTQLTPRESVLMEHESEENRLAREYAIKIKELEIELAKEEHTAEIELERLKSKWGTWLRLPVLVIKLPLFILLGFAYICSMFTKKEMPKRFWDLLA